MNFDLSLLQARARFYVDYVTLADVDDDLDSPSVLEWPPVLDRRLAAQYLGISRGELSIISGNGPRGGQLQNFMVHGRVHWRLDDLQAYQEKETQNGQVALDSVL